MPLDPEDSRTMPVTEDSAERGLVKPGDNPAEPETYEDLGESDTPDGDVVGDVADEGRGHRG